MDMESWDVAFEWDGGLQDVDAPDVTLYGAVFRVHAPLESVANGLTRFAGEPKKRLGWTGRRLVWDRPPYQFTAQVRKDEVVLRAGNRLRPRPMQKVLDTLSDAGGKDLRVRAVVRQFCAPGANVRACTPCQAARIR